MSVKAGTAYVDVRGDFSRFNRDVDRATDSTKGKFAAFGATVGKAAKTGLLAFGGAAAIAGPKLVDLASDAEETASKFRTVFGKETGRAIRQLDAFSKATGTSRFALREQAAQFQALIRPMGLTTKAAGGMSVGMTKLATDLASFNNTSVEEAIVALQSGLVGEAEPLRKFGVQLSAARVEAFAYAEGIAKQGKELTAAQKAQAAYGIILKDTKLAQGDATRTAGSFANQWKRLKAQVTDTATEFAIALLPTVTKVIGAITSFIGQLKTGRGVGGRFVEILTGIGSAAGAAADWISGAFQTALQAVIGWINKNRAEIDAFASAVRNIATVVKDIGVFAFRKLLVPALEFLWSVTKRVWPAIKTVVEGTLKVISGLIKVFSGLFTGDFRRMWDGIKSVFSGALKIVGGLIRGATAPFREAAARVGDAISGAFDAAWRAVKGAVRSVIGWLGDRWEDIKGVFSNEKAKDALIRAITAPFRAAVTAIGNFIKLILQIVDKVPGVNVGGAIKAVDQFVKANGLARGGAFGRTGGMVRQPMVFMGEEAPRHPEFVIPTNPAYRKRARGLLAQAASAVGFASGGVWSHNELARLWERANPGFGNPHLMAAIAQAESGGNPNARNPSGASGLWQILGLPFPGNPFDPLTNARMAGAKLRTQGLGAWVVYNTGAYRRFLSGSWETRHQGFNPLNLIKNLVGGLPGVGDLPAWIQGLGSHVLGRVKDWIVDRVKGLGGAILGRSVPGWGQIDRIAREIGLSITSALRPGDDGFHGIPLGLSGRARATDYSNGFGPTSQMMRFARVMFSKFGSQLRELIYSPMGFGIKNGSKVGILDVFGSSVYDDHFDHVHVAFRKGGLFGLPYLGSYHDGGVAPQEGLAHVLRGEEMVPPGGSKFGRGMALTMTGDVHIHNGADVERGFHRVAFMVDA